MSIKSSDVIITATGKPGIISRMFADNKSIFAGKMLANIGAEDEFGDLFEESEVLSNKTPVNFSLELPTAMRYLDPIMYAHNLGARILVENQVPLGFHSLPKNMKMKY